MNKARVQLKHNGTLPSKLDMQAFVAATQDFFDSNCPLVFGIAFEEVSLLELIIFPKCKQALIAAKEARDANNERLMLQSLTMALEYLLKDFAEGTAVDGHLSAFSATRNFTFLSSFSLKVEGRLREFVDKTKEAIIALEDAIKFMSLGVDYHKVIIFKRLVSRVIYDVNDGILLGES